ncbi:uncharacterized protein LODBEIA_P60960 [Lodderomyces beijingensis]|uniref:Histidinol-phosphatase n=1 Tax=Lodderomyces beijingensis TaxID=1775926 RepID=A0ABP0ZVY4_9ASCO
MHTHHSHSGDYISHAHDTLEAMVNKYVESGFTTLCLTEHMPRLQDRFLYPEETEKGYSVENLNRDFEQYLAHAERLRIQHRDKIVIVVGLETEAINEQHIEYSRQLLQNPVIKMSVGSVHFVHEIPIDFSAELWLEAKRKSKNGLTRSLYKDYFELQSKVLDLKPTVVGHFDLIRLCQPQDDFDETTGKLTKDVDIQSDWPEVWDVIKQNITKVVDYDGLFELNSSAIRKGWDTPYPKSDIASMISRQGGKFCLSDDAHACSQVGLNYGKTLQYAKYLQQSALWRLNANGEAESVNLDTMMETMKNLQPKLNKK